VSVARLAEHARIWRGKPSLRLVYSVWFDALLSEVPASARVVEVGAGPGLFAEYARRRRPDLAWTASDLAPATGNDVVADAHALPFRAGAADAILGVDILHHVARPRSFFAEAARILRPGGRLALIEPWVTPLSFPVYRFFHQEDCAEPQDRWAPFAARGEGKELFDGNAGIPRAIVRDTPPEGWRSLDLEPPRTQLINGFAYLLTLGFRERSLLPATAAPAALWLDRALAPLAPVCALRARLVWTRAAWPRDEGARAGRSGRA
jgi:SAM-dependent methyltransferase